MTGQIKRLHTDKGFGFIASDNPELDDRGKPIEYFFHRSAVKNARFEDLQEGQTIVSFEPAEGTKGPRAEDVYV
jgi:cold shock CspA family protein